MEQKPLADLSAQELDAQQLALESAAAKIRREMEPFTHRLAEVAQDLERLSTERRRRQRLQQRESRALARAAAASGQAPSLEDLMATADGPTGSLTEVALVLKTGGRVVAGFPGARRPTLSLTDGAETIQVDTLGKARRWWQAGWVFGSPGRPGVRVHRAGTRQERLIGADEVFVDLAPQPDTTQDG